MATATAQHERIDKALTQFGALESENAVRVVEDLRALKEAVKPQDVTQNLERLSLDIFSVSQEGLSHAQTPQGRKQLAAVKEFLGADDKTFEQDLRKLDAWNAKKEALLEKGDMMTLTQGNVPERNAAIAPFREAVDKTFSPEQIVHENLERKQAALGDASNPMTPAALAGLAAEFRQSQNPDGGAVAGDLNFLKNLQGVVHSFAQRAQDNPAYEPMLEAYQSQLAAAGGKAKTDVTAFARDVVQELKSGDPKGKADAEILENALAATGKSPDKTRADFEAALKKGNYEQVLDQVKQRLDGMILSGGAQSQTGMPESQPNLPAPSAASPSNQR